MLHSADLGLKTKVDGQDRYFSVLSEVTRFTLRQLNAKGVMDVTQSHALSAVIVFLCGVTGGCAPGIIPWFIYPNANLGHEGLQKALSLSNVFSGGVLLSAAMTDMLPEAVEGLTKVAER